MATKKAPNKARRKSSSKPIKDLSPKSRQAKGVVGGRRVAEVEPMLMMVKEPVVPRISLK